MSVDVETTPALAVSSFATAELRVLVAWGEYDDAGLVPKVITVGNLDTWRTAKARIWKQFESVEGAEDWWGDLMWVIGEAFEPLATALWRINIGRSANNAVGAQLDGVGSAVNRERGGLVDSIYRGAIIVTGVGLFGGGTREDLNAGGRGLWGSRYVGVPEIYPGKQRMIVNDLSADEVRLALVVLGELRSAGVGSMLEIQSTSLTGPIDYGAGWLEDYGAAGYLGGEDDDLIPAQSFVSWAVAF